MRLGLQGSCLQKISVCWLAAIFCWGVSRLRARMGTMLAPVPGLTGQTGCSDLQAFRHPVLRVAHVIAEDCAFRVELTGRTGCRRRGQVSRISLNFSASLARLTHTETQLKGSLPRLSKDFPRWSCFDSLVGL